MNSTRELLAAQHDDGKRWRIARLTTTKRLEYWSHTLAHWTIMRADATEWEVKPPLPLAFHIQPDGSRMVVICD